MARPRSIFWTVFWAALLAGAAPGIVFLLIAKLGTKTTT